MKEILKSTGMWLFVIFVLFVLIIDVNCNTKNVSAEDTNNQTINLKN